MQDRFATDRLILDDSFIIGKGAERICYRHPEQPNLCVKVKYNDRKGKVSQNESDFKYYSFLEKQNISWSNITKCYGWVETDKGKGLIFDYVADTEGRPCSTAHSALVQGTLSPLRCFRQVDILFSYLVGNRVLVSELALDNLVYNPELENECKLVIVDGIGDRNLFTPVVTMCGFLAKLRLQKKYLEFRRKFNERFGAEFA